MIQICRKLMLIFLCFLFSFCLLSIQDNSSDEIPHRRMLRRETAVELPITPSKLSSAAAAATSSQSHDNEIILSVNERVGAEQSSPKFNRNMSAESSYSRPSGSQNYLVPSMSEPTQPRFRKSIESLQKNSSSETEYSMQPYRVIKQSSNETNTSLTGSFNVDQSSFGGQDISLDTNDTSALNITVIENTGRSESISPSRMQSKTSLDEFPTSPTPPPKAIRQISVDGGMRSLKKQFSIDHGSRALGQNRNDSTADTQKAIISLKPPTHGSLPTSSTKLASIVSSSTSTEESKDERNIPSINTNVIQDEIAKLSSNINNSNAEDDNKDSPFSETMC